VRTGLDDGPLLPERGDRETLIGTAERRISMILIELEEDLGYMITQVKVDIRDFADIGVKIFVDGDV
jgi:hypothetical protein